MKKTIFLLASLIATLGFVACSNDDDGATSSTTTFDIPLAVNNYWKYNVQVDADVFTDSLYIPNDTIISNKTYKKFKTLDVPAGFYSSSLNNNGAIYENGKMLVSGTLTLGQYQNLPTGFTASVVDLVVFDKDASNGDQLNSNPLTGSTQQTYQGFTFDIDYTLNTYGGETLASFTSPDGTTYTNVKTSVVKLNLVVSNALLSGLNILSNPEVMTSTLYFADGIGMVYSDTNLNIIINSTAYALIQLQGLNIPQTTTQSQEEFLTNYLLN